MRRIRYGFIAAGVAAAAVAVPTNANAAAVPAAAAASGSAAAQEVTFTVRDAVVIEAGTAVPMRLSVPDAEEGFLLENAKVAIDTTAVAGFATVDATTNTYAQPDCTTAGTITTCDLGTIASHSEFGPPTLHVKVKPGSEPGSSGKLTLTLTADDTEPLVATSTITVAQDTDLTVTIAAKVPEARPGERVTPAVQITNLSDKQVQGVALRLATTDGLRRAGDFENCYHLGDFFEQFCRFDTTLEPGKTYVVEGQPIGVSDNAKPGTGTYSATIWTLDDFNQNGLAEGYPHGTGAPIKLVEQAATTKAQKVPSVDGHFANNLADGTVKILAAATTSPSPTPTTTATTPAPGDGSAGGDTGGSGGGGGLPVTGTPVGVIAGVGAGILLLGAAGFFTARRRRARFVA